MQQYVIVFVLVFRIASKVAMWMCPSPFTLRDVTLCPLSFVLGLLLLLLLLLFVNGLVMLIFWVLLVIGSHNLESTPILPQPLHYIFHLLGSVQTATAALKMSPLGPS